MADDTHDVLRRLVEQARCKPGWSFRMVDESGALRFVVRVSGYDSSQPDERVPMTVNHFFPVPTATYNEKSWRRWMFEMCRRVENHELGEWFRIGSEWPFAPCHAPGEDPYTVHEYRTPEDALTTQDGSMRSPYVSGQS
jgi:hypothetical protein